MNSMSELCEFLGWATIINLAYLTLASLVIVFMKGAISKIHARMFSVDEAQIPVLYFEFLSRFKLLTIIFVVAPYLSLKIMGY
jgi:predicted metallopeptidase